MRAVADTEKNERPAEATESAPNKWLVFFAVAVGVFMSTLDGSIVNIALPAIMNDLAAPLSTVEWVMMIYLLTVSALLLSFGRLSDIRGRRWVYTRGLIVFAIGSLFCGLARSALWLIAARAFQGLGAAMIMSCTQAIVVDRFPFAERGRAMGMIGAVVASGLTVGPALGGWLLHHFNWQTIFYINIPIGLVTAFFADRLLRSGPSDVSRAERFDWFGSLFLIVCLTSSLFVITHVRRMGIASPVILGGLLVSLLTVLGLIRTERTVSHPLLAPSLLRIRLFTFPALAAMVLFAGLFIVVFLMPFFLVHPYGLSEHAAGYLMVTLFAVLFVFAPISGSLSDRIGSRFLCTLGMAVLTVSLYYLSAITPEMSRLDVAWRLALAGSGIAVFTAPNNAAVMSAVPPRFMGVAAGTVATVRNLGMVLGIALAGAIFNHVFHTLSGGMDLKVYHPELEPFFMEAFRYAMLSGTVVCGFGTLLSFLRGPDKR